MKLVLMEFLIFAYQGMWSLLERFLLSAVSCEQSSVMIVGVRCPAKEFGYRVDSLRSCEGEVSHVPSPLLGFSRIGISKICDPPLRSR